MLQRIVVVAIYMNACYVIHSIVVNEYLWYVYLWYIFLLCSSMPWLWTRSYITAGYQLRLQAGPCPGCEIPDVVISVSCSAHHEMHSDQNRHSGTAWDRQQVFMFYRLAELGHSLFQHHKRFWMHRHQLQTTLFFISLANRVGVSMFLLSWQIRDGNTVYFPITLQLSARCVLWVPINKTHQLTLVVRCWAQDGCDAHSSIPRSGGPALQTVWSLNIQTLCVLYRHAALPNDVLFFLWLQGCSWITLLLRTLWQKVCSRWSSASLLKSVLKIQQRNSSYVWIFTGHTFLNVECCAEG